MDCGVKELRDALDLGTVALLQHPGAGARWSYIFKLHWLHLFLISFGASSCVRASCYGEK